LRDDLQLIQTPQGYHYDQIFKAHTKNKNKEFNVLSDNYERIIDQLNKLRQEYNNNVLELKNINITNDKQKMIYDNQILELSKSIMKYEE
jgi:hypothetical protein